MGGGGGGLFFTLSTWVKGMGTDQVKVGSLDQLACGRGIIDLVHDTTSISPTTGHLYPTRSTYSLSHLGWSYRGL